MLEECKRPAFSWEGCTEPDLRDSEKLDWRLAGQVAARRMGQTAPLKVQTPQTTAPVGMGKLVKHTRQECWGNTELVRRSSEVLKYPKKFSPSGIFYKPTRT